MSRTKIPRKISLRMVLLYQEYGVPIKNNINIEKNPLLMQLAIKGKYDKGKPTILTQRDRKTLTKMLYILRKTEVTFTLKQP